MHDTIIFWQVLGEKPDLPEGASDDIKADASNRKMAKLYKVATGFKPCKYENSPCRP